MLYDGYLVQTYTDGWGGREEKRTYLGKTTANSKKQAENNFRFRTKGKAVKSYTRDLGYDACVTEYFLAEPADTTTKIIKDLVEKAAKPETTPIKPAEPEYEQASFNFADFKGW